jgi:ATP-dependent phosphofructokinase / diphosphate-dependent phosphofructokinase
MSQPVLGNLLVLQGGGPTPVVNVSLYAVIHEARRSGRFGRILGARNGVEGLCKDDLIELTDIPMEELGRLRVTPGASLGTSRYKASPSDLERITSLIKTRDINSILVIGGNGSLQAAAALDQTLRQSGDACVLGIPKTIDNDINGTDRCPGFGSAARYATQAVRDLGMDVRTLPQPVSIFETMGRGAGWLAGATLLAKIDEQHAPHLIYLPEKPFNTDRFLADVDRTVQRLGWCVAVVSEGIRNDRGQAIFEVADNSQRDAMNRALPGGVAAYLADVVTRNLKIRCRSEKPGLCGRSSALHLSKQDFRDAELVGRAGVNAIIERKTGQMVALRPLRDTTGDGTELVPLSQCTGERVVPSQWLTDDATAVNGAFLNYVSPLVGPLMEYAIPLKER